MESIFKAGDKVYDIQFGWGEVVGINIDEIYSIVVDFKNSQQSYTVRGAYCELYAQPNLSFTEYTLQEFSQERPFNPQDCVGKWCTVFDELSEELDGEIYRITKIYLYHEDGYFTDIRETTWYFVKPLTEEQLQAFNLTND